ncbi:peptide deformylase [Shimia gijangensis]|uniref:Peptide deformylase n=1 Tax=Shimia gijangensis TaxID=1470563 RepID=A0A1M6BHL3_9RHOB|nr:peptide deformylase [Shimia gijangensis]SHI48199.1 peptide deformylase [Shimia gijangensis]
MSTLPILHWPDTRLATVCERVDRPSAISQLAEKMLRTMYDAKGRGLAAPQVGVLARLFVMDPTWKDSAESPYVCINPQITDRSEELVTGEEACLSIPGISADVTRHAEITLWWQDVDSVWVEERLTGFAAVCAQHELDHLDGVVIFDRVNNEMRTRLEQDYKVQG